MNLSQNVGDRSVIMDNDEDRFELEVKRELAEGLLDTEEQEVFREWLEQLESE